MAIFPNFSQMPKGSYPLNAHPIYSLVGSLLAPVITGIKKINKVFMSNISKLNKVSQDKIGSVNEVEN